MSDAIVRWTLWHAGRSITCTEQIGPGGLEVQVTYDSLPLATQHCDRMEDAVRWADQIRQRWETSGWSGAESAVAPVALEESRLSGFEVLAPQS